MSNCAYDIIGDIHGHAQKLWDLLESLGYSKRAGVYVHPRRRALFLGDFIDRGPQQIEVLETVREMMERADARSIIGNHELNAIGWASVDTQGRALREHNDKNYHQHEAFLDAVDNGSAAHREWVDWFQTLPVWLALPELQLVHACWSQRAVDILAEHLTPEHCVNKAQLPILFDEKHPAFEAIEILLKGPEVSLPEGHSFHDKDNNQRHRARIRWWLEQGTLRDAALVPSEIASQLPAQCLADELKRYGNLMRPTFIGHYWMRGQPAPLNNQVACLDYSVAKKGQLVAYRFDGEIVLNKDHFVAV